MTSPKVANVKQKKRVSQAKWRDAVMHELLILHCAWRIAMDDDKSTRPLWVTAPMARRWKKLLDSAP